MTNPLTERVARAICRANGKDPDAVDYKGKAQWEEYKTDAQAARKAYEEYAPEIKRVELRGKID